MKLFRFFIFNSIVFTFLLGCKNESKVYLIPADSLHQANRRLLEVAMEDGFPPPVASRVYVYPHAGAYLALAPFSTDGAKNLILKLHGLEKFSFPDTSKVNAELASLLVFYKVSKKVVFSEHYMLSAIDSLVTQSKSAGIDPIILASTQTYSDSIASQMIKWLMKDNYIETRTMERFTSVKEPGFWQETPPDYQQALEPHWSKIRPIMIDSAGIYKAEILPPFSRDKNSPFFLMAKKVFDESKNPTPEKEEIAWFWDDNPNTSDHRGHAVAVIHKISPPGHWLNIISQIAKKEKYTFAKSSQIYTITAIAMFDGIISTWHQKYKSNLVRPITYIHDNIDPNWSPLIQTPPFPEYTSGHSVISASAATILSHLIGENYAFVDSTSMLYGAKSRNFTDFHAAAWEVSLSRYYGGIHYYNGVEEGNKQGKWVGNYILNKLNIN